jgi:hypothetical protein
MKHIALVFIALVILPAAVFAADPSKAQVVTFKSNLTSCLASVAIKQVDGKLRQLPTMGFEIEPGWHTMHGVSTVNLKHCPLEWLFDPGKVYYVGLDHSSPERKNWRLVVWKIESMDEEETDADG